MNRIKKAIPYLVISLILHLSFAIIIEQLPEISKEYNSEVSYDNSQPLRIQSIERNYRKVGIKDGQKEYDIQGKSTKPNSPSELVDLSSLAPQVKVENIKPLSKKTNKEGPTENKKVEVTFQPPTKTEKIVQKRFIKKIVQDRFLDPVLNNSDFALNPEIPEGVDVNELNSAEKIFYSFKKRTMEQYLSSFVDQYQTTKKIKPQITKKLIDGRHALSGRITFDKDGNIVTIKIIKSSQDDDIHNLFEETLKGINKVPNPPKDLLSKNEQFSIYYILKIN